jgi:nitrogenase iron protein NifH
MLKLAVYGKGGIGKSTISGNLSSSFARSGSKVLHIGCDPKSDSTSLLLKHRRPPTVAGELALCGGKLESMEPLIIPGFGGVDCIEAGGPEPGVGCGGWAIARMAQELDKSVLNKPGRYDVVLFDVLGDVVCGGFAAPLRKGFANRVVIVVSEEIMSLYACNNICRAIVRLKANGPRLAGIIINRRSNDASLKIAEAFIAEINSKVAAVIPRDPVIGEAEKKGVPLFAYAPESETTKTLINLSKLLLEMPPEDLHLPTPLEEEEFFDFVRSY